MVWRRLEKAMGEPWGMNVQKHMQTYERNQQQANIWRGQFLCEKIYIFSNVQHKEGPSSPRLGGYVCRLFGAVGMFVKFLE